MNENEYMQQYGKMGLDAARAVMDMANEPFASQQMIELPSDYVAKSERCRGALIGAGVIIGAALTALAVWKISK